MQGVNIDFNMDVNQIVQALKDLGIKVTDAAKGLLVQVYPVFRTQQIVYGKLCILWSIILVVTAVAIF